MSPPPPAWRREIGKDMPGLEYGRQWTDVVAEAWDKHLRSTEARLREAETKRRLPPVEVPEDAPPELVEELRQEMRVRVDRECQELTAALLGRAISHFPDRAFQVERIVNGLRRAEVESGRYSTSERRLLRALRIVANRGGWGYQQ